MAFLQVNDITKFFGGLCAVHKVSFEVNKGEILGMIGPNGAGKSTIFNLMTGFIPLTSGEVNFKGVNLNGYRADQICSMGMVRTFQLVQTFRRMTALESVTVGALKRCSSISTARAKAWEVLETMGLADKAHQMTKNLTIAQLKRLEIAKALATDPEFLLIDEGMAGLTPSETEEAIALMQKLNRNGLTLFLIEHVMKVIMALSERIIVIHHGEKIAEGAPDEVANNERVVEAYLGKKK